MVSDLLLQPLITWNYQIRQHQGL